EQINSLEWIDSAGTKFDPIALQALKNDHNGYKFCPRCSEKLVKAVMDSKERVVCPDSSCRFIYYQNPVPAAGVIVHESRGLLLVKRAHPPLIGWWCLPAGYMEWDESPIKTALRETIEETGLEVEVESLLGLYSGDDDPRTNAILALYRAKIIGGELKAGDDASEVEFFPLDSLPEKIAFVAHRQAISELKTLLEL
ncbi:MAG: NUDIX hydrolase, partial [candidate division Zixibacteria bacterium]|nr:NUDIX hydrolase [candidate division Zixibacteria bacterium]